MARWYTRRSSIIRAVSYCSGCAPVGCEKKKKNIEEEKRKMSISKLKLCNFHKSTRERESKRQNVYQIFVASEASLSTPFIGGEPVSVANYP